MVNHCANPVCHKPLHYLRDGKIFLFSHKRTDGNNSKLPLHLEHYWLCGTCAKEWKLDSDGNNGVKLIETKRKRFRTSYAAASAAPAS